MKQQYAIALALVVLLAALSLVFQQGDSHLASAQTSATSNSRLVASQVIVATIPTRRTFTFRLPWIGIVETAASVTLPSPIAGRVTALAVKDQASVKAGSPVASLGGPQVQGERADLQAKVASLQIRLKLAAQTAAWLKQDWQAKLIIRAQMAAAQAKQAELTGQLRRARLALAILEKNTSILAPMNGIFTGRRVSVGQDIKAGQVIGEIIDTRHLRIIASIFPSQDMKLQGMEATIRQDNAPSLNGHVQSVLPRAGNNGAVQVWIEGDAIDRQLRPGQTVGGDIVLQVRPEVLAVPESAIVYDQDETPFLFIRQGSAYKPQQVRLGVTQDGWVEILSGVTPHQSVVTQGAYELFHHRFNQRFKVQD